MNAINKLFGFRIGIQLIVFIAIGLAPVSGVEFAVKGRVRHEVWRSTGQEFEVEKNFSVDLKDGVWRLKTWGVGANDQVFEVGYEDGILFRLYKFLQNNQGVLTNACSALVKNGVIPDDDASLLNYLWLAYCSAGFVAERTDGKLEPIWLLDDPTLNAEGFKLSATVTQMSLTSPPSMVAYFSDGNYRVRNGNERELVPAPAPYNQGYTNAIFLAQATTNVNGIQIPSSWSFVRYMPDRNGSTDRNRLLPRTITRGLVESISSRVSVGSLRPVPPADALVRDERFAQVGKPVAQTEVRYFVTNGVWPSTAELRPAFTNSLQRFKRN